MNSQNKTFNWLFGLIIVCSLIGLGASIESTLAHYDVTSSEFCSVNETFDCDVVNKSSYSVLFGIPVAVYGILAYLALLLGTLMYRTNKNPELLKWLVALAVGGVIFSLYLTAIEAFVLYTWCLVCLTSQACILIIAGCLAWLQRMASKVPEKVVHE